MTKTNRVTRGKSLWFLPPRPLLRLCGEAFWLRLGCSVFICFHLWFRSFFWLRLFVAYVLVLPGIAALPALENPRPAQQQPKVRRLILKDGSYELISKYEIRGDRVRYLSSERHQWEEAPYSLVDWPATERFAQEAASERQSGIRQLRENEARERAEEDANTPVVSPGIRLPDTGGVFLLDTFQGKPELNQLRQNGADVNKNTAGNIVRAAINPFAGSKQSIELKGTRAAIQSHVATPFIYLAMDSSGDPPTDYTPEMVKEHFRIVRCEEKKGNRTVGILNISVSGKAKDQVNFVETAAEAVSGRWVKVTAGAPLQTGEYALVELLEKDRINAFVWDFGVNPDAPANVDARKQEATKPRQPPVLQKRKGKEVR